MDKNSNQGRNLEAVSGIREEILERNTRKRVQLFRALTRTDSKKKWYIIGGSLAATLAVVLSAVLLIVHLVGGKQIPIYTGMTVSDAPGAVVAAGCTESYLSNGNGNGVRGDHAHGHQNVGNHPFGKPISDVLTVVGGGEDLYYATAGEFVYVTVHLDNPDAFEIQSFTLNGTKYANYMFEDGSDLENLILKVQLPADAAGRMRYTIDAIKYIDGESIKDVRMDGDKTVEIGVSTTRQPAAALSEEQIGFTALSFAVQMTDELELITVCGGKVQAVLYDGDRLVQTKALEPKGTVTVTFEGLAENTLYQYAVVAEYDALDGAGYAAHILVQKSFYTKNYVLFQDVAVTESGITFSYLWDAAATDPAILSLKLYEGANERVLDAAATAVDGLTAGREYRLVATYRQGGAEKQIELIFTTHTTYQATLYHQSNTDVQQLVAGAALPTVIRAGYTFVAWEDAEGNRYTTMPEKAVVLHAVWEEETPVSALQYTVTAQGATITGLVDATRTVLQLPAYIEGKTVIALGDNAFARQSALQRVEVPFGVTEIGMNVFFRCDGLTDICFTPDSRLKVIGCYAFFQTGIATIRLPSSLEEIWGGAFEESALREIAIPASVRHLGNEMFAFCASLETVTIHATAMDCLDEENGYRQSPIFQYAGGEAGIELIFGAGVTRIPDELCYGTDVKLTVRFAAGSTCTEIGECAFQNCKKLTSIEIPASVTKLGKAAFSGCLALEQIHFNATNMADGDGASYGVLVFDREASRTTADGLAVTVGANVKRIPAELFAGSPVTAVTFAADSVCTEIGERAFSNCSKLTSIEIPASVTHLGQFAINNCRALEQIYFNATNMPDYEPENPYGWSVFTCSEPTADALTLTVGANVKRIPAKLFSGAAITEVTFAAGSVCTEIGAEAFSLCAELARITLPASLQTVGAGAFGVCEALVRVDYLGTLATWQTGISFANNTANPLYNSGCKLYINNQEVTP